MRSAISGLCNKYKFGQSHDEYENAEDRSEDAANDGRGRPPIVPTQIKL